MRFETAPTGVEFQFDWSDCCAWASWGWAACTASGRFCAGSRPRQCGLPRRWTRPHTFEGLVALLRGSPGGWRDRAHNRMGALGRTRGRRTFPFAPSHALRSRPRLRLKACAPGTPRREGRGRSSDLSWRLKSRSWRSWPRRATRGRSESLNARAAVWLEAEVHTRPTG